MNKTLYKIKKNIILCSAKKQIKRGYIKVYYDKVFPGDNVLIMFGKGSVITGKLISMNLVKDLLPDMDVIEYIT